MKKQAIEWLTMGGGGALIVSAAARALPEPQPLGNRFYAWFFKVTHILLANFDKSFQ